MSSIPDGPCRLFARMGLWLALVSAAGCGYTVGAPFSPEIRSVHVPIFKSGSNRRFLEYQLTEAVQKQIQQRSHFRLVKEADADTRLTGRIIDLRKSALGQTANSDARELQVNLQVEMTWEDLRSGAILRQQRIPLPPEMLQLAAQAEYAPEVGQSLATGDQTVIDRLARNIVDMMETPW
ncbi:MAG TPA: LPS assembly lipoprotein LptE [Planctomycetaceae bacterium]|nr:LPS assembly lipoprotein LptE [Planctomycetaceae bacterium]